MAELTESEVKELFLDHILDMAEYWHQQHGADREQLLNMAFSILVAIDGAGALPKFILAPDPHPEDREFRNSQDDDWYPENHDSDVACDITGELHSELLKRARERWP